MKKKSILSTIHGNAEDFTEREKQLMAIADNLENIQLLQKLRLITPFQFRQLMSIHYQIKYLINENKQVQLEIPTN